MLTIKTQSILVIQGLGNKLRQESQDRDGVPSHGGLLSPAVLTAPGLALETSLGMLIAEALLRFPHACITKAP